MGFSDTAEYWWGIKNRKPYTGRDFVHFKNSPCGHINPTTGNTDQSEYLADINCFACLKLIKENGNIYGLKEGLSKRQQSDIDREKHLFRFGKCECGSPLCERVNKKTNQKFLGCVRYPNCTKTKSLTP